MTWEEKFLAIQAIDDRASLKMRSPGNWYVSDHLERVEGPYLSGGLEQGKTPEDAVEQRWAWLTSPEYPVIRVNAQLRVRWAVFMWKNEKREEI